jgi:hypothetical protein
MKEKYRDRGGRLGAGQMWQRILPFCAQIARNHAGARHNNAPRAMSAPVDRALIRRM